MRTCSGRPSAPCIASAGGAVLTFPLVALAVLPTHPPMGQVGRAMASPEKKAWHIFRSLDVKYVFVVFGGYIG